METKSQDVHQVEDAPQHHHEPVHIVPMTVEAHENDRHINLSWRSWLVVFWTCFAIMAQVYVVTGAGSVIAFIVRDLGEEAISGWIIQGPLLMQSVLSPIVGRLSDVIDRRYLASMPPLIAFVGSVICAKATSMNMLIGGGILIGVTLATISIVQAIPSEILPLKYRALANGFAFLGGAVGGIVGGVGAGGVTNANQGGWRDIFWMGAAFHGATSLGLLAFYWPQKRSDYPKMSFKEYLWACDPIGSCLFVISATLMLLALNWAGGAYAWSDAHVVAPLVIGLVLLVVFGLYEWKGRSDGIVAHVFFSSGPNFALSTFAFAVEGWIFYSAVNSITPQIVLNLGFEDNAWDISIRQLSYNLPCLFFSIPIFLYATKFKDMKSPLIATFTLFLVVTICYACISPTWSKGQFGLNVISGVGQSGPLTLLVACVQFTAPHAFLSTATGLAFSARAIGGAFGSAVINAIVNGRLNSHYARDVGSAAIAAGLPASEVPEFLAYLAATSTGVEAPPGLTSNILVAAAEASRWSYAKAYRLGWASVIPFVVLALVAVSFLRGVKELMTEKVEATVEHVPASDGEKNVQ